MARPEAGAWWRAHAPAKVNPYLRVLGRRADGYHEVELWMLALEWGDELRARTLPDAQLQFAVCGAARTPDVPADERNLAWRAALAVLEAARLRRPELGELGLALELEKRLPSQAGLGGGSSDAAAAALLVQQVLGEPLAEQELVELLWPLGADCAFFLAARQTGYARCTGRGELVQPKAAPAPGWWVALAVPQLPAQTAAVYRAWSSCLSPGAPTPSFPDQFFACDLEEARGHLFNQLEAAAAIAVPQLSQWRALLNSSGLSHFRLSGSGSAFFGLYRDAALAQAELAELRRRAAAEGLLLRAAQVTRPARQGASLLERSHG